MQVCLQSPCEPLGPSATPSGCMSPSPGENVIKNNLSSTAVSAVAALAVQQHQQQLVALASDLHGTVSRWCQAGCSPDASSSSDSSLDHGPSCSPVQFRGLFPLDGKRGSDEVTDEVHPGKDSGLFFSRPKYILPPGCRIYRIPQSRVPIPRHLYREEAALEDDDGLPSLSGLDDDTDFICCEEDNSESAIHPKPVSPKIGVTTAAPAVPSPRFRSEEGASSKDWGEWPLRPIEGGERGQEEEPSRGNEEAKGVERREDDHISYRRHSSRPCDPSMIVGEENPMNSSSRIDTRTSIVDHNDDEPTKKPYWESCKSFLDSGASSILAQLSSFHQKEGVGGEKHDEEKQSLFQSYPSLINSSHDDGNATELLQGEGVRDRENRTRREEEEEQQAITPSTHPHRIRSTEDIGMPLTSRTMEDHLRRSSSISAVHEIRKKSCTEKRREPRADDEKKEEKEDLDVNYKHRKEDLIPSSKKTPSKDYHNHSLTSRTSRIQQDISSSSHDEVKSLFIKSVPSPPSDTMVGRLSSSSSFEHCRRTFSSDSVANQSEEEEEGTPRFLRLPSTTHRGLFGVDKDDTEEQSSSSSLSLLSSVKPSQKEFSRQPSTEEMIGTGKRSRESISLSRNNDDDDNSHTKKAGRDACTLQRAPSTKVCIPHETTEEAPVSRKEDRQSSSDHHPYDYPPQECTRHFSSPISSSKDFLGDTPRREGVSSSSSPPPPAGTVSPAFTAPGTTTTSALGRTATSESGQQRQETLIHRHPHASRERLNESSSTSRNRLHQDRTAGKDKGDNMAVTASSSPTTALSSYEASSGASNIKEERKPYEQDEEEEEEKKSPPPLSSVERQSTFLRSTSGLPQTVDSRSFSRSFSSSSTLEQHTLLKDPVEAAASAAAAAAAEAAEAAAALRNSSSFSRSSSLVGVNSSKNTSHVVPSGGGGGGDGERFYSSSPTARNSFQYEFTHFVHEWLADCAVRLREFAFTQDQQAPSSSTSLHTRQTSKTDDHSMHALVVVTKRRLKDELKSYDLEFQKRYGRLPNRPEKEPLRHLYSHYQYLRRALLRLEYKNDPHNNRPTASSKGGGKEIGGANTSRGGGHHDRYQHCRGGDEKTGRGGEDRGSRSKGGSDSSSSSGTAVESQQSIRGDDTGRIGEGGGGGRYSSSSTGSRSHTASHSNSSTSDLYPSPRSKDLRGMNTRNQSTTRQGSASSSSFSVSSSASGIARSSDSPRRGDSSKSLNNTSDSNWQDGHNRSSSSYTSSHSMDNGMLQSERSSKRSGRISRGNDHEEAIRRHHELGDNEYRTRSRLTERSSHTGGRAWEDEEEERHVGRGLPTSRTENYERSDQAGAVMAPASQGSCFHVQRSKTSAVSCSGHQSEITDEEGERGEDPSSSSTSRRPVGGTVVVSRRSSSRSLQKRSTGDEGAGRSSFNRSCTYGNRGGSLLSKKNEDDMENVVRGNESFVSNKQVQGASFPKVVVDTNNSNSPCPAARLVGGEKVMIPSSKLVISKQDSRSDEDKRGGETIDRKGRRIILSSGSHSSRDNNNSNSSGAPSTNVGSTHHRPQAQAPGGEYVLHTHDDIQQRLTRLQQEKKVLRTKLLAYQADFVAETGRVVQLYKDIAPIEREYRRYKEVKQEILRLLEKQKTGCSTNSNGGGVGNASAVSVKVPLMKRRESNNTDKGVTNTSTCLTYKAEEEEEDGPGGIPSETYEPGGGGARIYATCR
ncbi:hypothetical protein CSUI_001395 [Cystoisospora suis]|uniref:FAM13A-like domain-containing protein n=1 Tax=Cystoisospora suis TaxID=483139 RepID=A0A2C6KL42_9APIC|nr:hypothetical protein CSUI_001395 [Cystoisospora suis]